MIKITENLDDVEQNHLKNDKNYRKFRWCRKNHLKMMKITENFDGVEKNLLKNDKNYRKFG